MDHTANDKAMSLRELILKIQEYIGFLWKKKWWIILLAISTAAFFVYRGYDKPRTFTGKMVMGLQKPSSSAGLGGGVGSILGQIGLGGGGENSLTKVKTMSLSYDILTKTLLDSAILNGENDLIANHFIKTQQLHKEIFPDINERFANYLFPHNRKADFKPDDLRILKFLYRYIVRHPDYRCLKVEEEEETASLALEIETNSPALTLALLEGQYTNLRKTYVDQSTAPQRNTLEELRVKSDSIADKLEKVEYQLAAMQDRTLGLTSSRQLVRQADLQREANLLNATYIEVLRNAESADFLLKTAKPDIQIVESPVLPLDSQGPNNFLSAIIGCIFGGILGTMIFLLIKVYRDIMHEETPQNV